MSLAESAMGLGLKALNRFAGSTAIDRLGLRQLAERGLFHSTKAGFAVAGKAVRRFAAAQKLLQPARLPRAGAAGLFDLTPSDEQQMLREAARTFAIERLRVEAAAADAATAAPVELLAESAALGFTALGIPESLGGAGSERSTVSNVLIAEALAEGDLSLAIACLAPSAVATALTLWGNAAQQAQYLPSFASEEAPTAALAVQEPQPLFDAFALATTATRTAQGYVLDGVKSLVPRGADCELFVIAAMLDGQPQLFLVESKTRGLTLQAEPAMGLRAASTARLTLKQVAVDASALLGSSADYAECIALSRLAWCALAVGCGQAVLDHVIPYANERIAFGEPISHRQAVAFMIADISVELEGLRLATWRAAAKAERGEDFVRETAIARQLATDKAMKIGNDGVQVLGGHGFTKEYPVERWYRDLRACGFMEGIVLV
ncbi:MAG: acyl-CoA dehydrogenase family protein [Pseudomonadota bacterium]